MGEISMKIVVLFVLLGAVQVFSDTSQSSAYINDDVAMPDVMSMMQMKAGVAAAAGVSLATGQSDVVVNGALFGNGNGHFASSLLVDKEVRATGDMKSDSIISAKTALNTKGTVTAAKKILSLE